MKRRIFKLQEIDFVDLRDGDMFIIDDLGNPALSAEAAIYVANGNPFVPDGSDIPTIMTDEIRKNKTTSNKKRFIKP